MLQVRLLRGKITLVNVLFRIFAVLFYLRSVSYECNNKHNYILELFYAIKRQSTNKVVYDLYEFRLRNYFRAKFIC